MPIPIDRSKWHSQRYVGQYDERATEYEGIRCRCRKCGASFVCTAEQQKEAYEVKKKSVFWLPKFCEACEACEAERKGGGVGNAGESFHSAVNNS
jgi:hypothetical protein